MPEDGTAGSVPQSDTTAELATSTDTATTTQTTPVAAPTTLPSTGQQPAEPTHINLGTVTIETVIPVDSQSSVDFTLPAIAFVVVCIGIYVYLRGKKQDTKEGEGRCDSLQAILEAKKRELEEHLRTWPEEKLKEMAVDAVAGSLEKNTTLAPAVQAARTAKERYEQLQKAVQLLESEFTLCKISLPPTPNPDLEVRESKIEGKGVFALRDFRKGERVVEWGKRKELTQAELQSLSEDMRMRYTSTVGGKKLLSGEPMRFVNHSCNPNTNPKDNGDVALRDIRPGEEITSQYKDFEAEGATCKCGAENCKRQASG